MSFRGWGRLAATLLATLICVACGQVYRPVVIPCTALGGTEGCPVEPPPTPANFHAVFGISANVPNGINVGGSGYPGAAMQIDVSGASIIAETSLTSTGEPNSGLNPTHVAISPNDSRLFVASASSVFAGGIDVVSSFTPAFQFGGSGFGAISTIALPQGSLPVFLNTTQNGFVYVANFGTNSVSAINTSLNAVSNTATVGVNPVALAETPSVTANGALKLYVANQGIDTATSSVSSLNVTDLSSNPVTGFTGINPVWVVARGDSQKVYVLTQGDGKLITMDTATDTATTPDCSVTPSLCVGAGANFIFYDPHLNRLYVTNPVTSMVYAFSDTGGANDTPTLLTAISFGPGSAPCPSGCSPVSVAALPDGSRFYVASYQLASSCPDPVIGSTVPCVIPSLTVFDANSLTPKITPALTLLTWAPPCTTSPCPTGPFATNQYAVPPLAACGPVAPGVPSPLYSPTATRFRVFTAAAADSSAVYVSMCDAGFIAVINTTDNNANGAGNSGTPADTLVTDLPAAFSNGAPQANGEPPNQNPIFLLTGQ